MNQVRRRLLGLISPVTARAALYKQEFYNPAQVTSAQYGQTVLLFKLKLS